MAPFERLSLHIPVKRESIISSSIPDSLQLEAKFSIDLERQK